MRVVRASIVALIALLIPVLASATHVPGSGEVIVYDGTLAPGSAATGSIGWTSPLDGYDWYCFNVTSGTAVSIRATRTSGDIVPNLGIMNGLAEEGGTASLPIVDETNNSSDTSVTLTFTPNFSGTVTLWVSTFLNEEGGAFSVTMTGGTAGSCTGEVEEPTSGSPFQVQIPSELFIDPLFMTPAATETVDVSVAVTAPFSSDLSLSVVSDAQEHEDFHVSLNDDVFPAPGVGEAVVTVTTGSLTFPRTYVVLVTATTPDGTESEGNSFLVHVSCDPPFILGTNQPKSITAANGTQVTLEVIASGTGPFFYQWYKGVPGMTRNPVLAANESQLIFTTRETATYWVRVSNACGTVNSTAATVTTTGTLSGPARRRSGR